MNKKFIKIVLLIVLVISAWFVFFLMDEEQQDWRTNEYEKKVCQKLLTYFDANQKFPNNLEEIGINPQFSPILNKTFLIHYQLSSNKIDFYLASKVNKNFVIYHYPLKQEKGSIRDSCLGGFAFEEAYRGERKDFPIYRKSLPVFKNPEEWPKL